MKYPWSFNTFVRVKKVAVIFSVLFVIQILIGTGLIYFVSMKQAKNVISKVSDTAVRDITYKNHTWNTTKYDSDPEIPGNYRIYVVTKDGFIIDRWRPIPGYLDTSDFKQQLTYQVPKTVHTITGQTWRLFGLPIKDGSGNIVGLVSVGRYGNEFSNLSATDTELEKSAKAIEDDITVNGSDIDTSKVDILEIPFQVSFQVVDQYNKIHIKSDNASSLDRLPNYIDPSYIANELKRPSLRVIKDDKNHESFLVKATPLTDQNHHPVGTIIVARTISPNLQLVKTFVIVEYLTGIVLIPAACLMYLYWKKKEKLAQPVVELPKRIDQEDIKNISFSKQASEIIINGKKIGITYSTNQYYMCLTLFSSPKRKWETDELIEKFGLEHTAASWRITYDAMTSINKKVAAETTAKLIISNNKTYQINPELTGLIK